MSKLVKLVALCKCGQAYYDTPGGWNGMLSHINDDNNKVHEWIACSDLVLMKEPGSTDITTKLGGT